MAIIDTGVDANSSPVPRPGRPGNERRHQRLRQRRHGDLRRRHHDDWRRRRNRWRRRRPAEPTRRRSPTADGHGTLVAGVVAQFVPQATIVPVNIFAPFLASLDRDHDRRNGGGGGTGGGGRRHGPVVRANSNALTEQRATSTRGSNYVADAPVRQRPDPARHRSTA